MLHDAFLKFDYSRTGMLSLDEVYGAFEWLKIPVTPEEVLFFVRSVSRDPLTTASPTTLTLTLTLPLPLPLTLPLTPALTQAQALTLPLTLTR
jgi:hypothetical protein